MPVRFQFGQPTGPLQQFVDIRVLRRWQVFRTQQPIHQRDQPQAELLAGEVPLAVPVRVRDDVNVHLISVGQRGKGQR